MSLLKHEFQARYVIIGITFHAFKIIFISYNVFENFSAKIVQRVLVLNLVKMSKELTLFLRILKSLAISKTRFTTIQSPFVSVE